MNPDSLAVATAVGQAIDGIFNGLAPEARALLIGVLTFVIYQGWKWVVNPNTPPLQKVSAWWEANKGWLNAILPAIVAWIAGGQQPGFSGIIALIAPMLTHRVVKSVSAKGTPEGNKAAGAAVGLLLASLLLSARPADAGMVDEMKARLRPTVAVGVVERWDSIIRAGGERPTPYVCLTPGINWNDHWVIRARAEYGLDRAGMPLRHEWRAEVGVHYVIFPR